MTNHELDLKAYGNMGSILAIANLTIAGIKKEKEAVAEIQKIAKEFSDDCTKHAGLDNGKVGV